MSKHPDRSKVYAREAARRGVSPYAVEDAKWEALARERAASEPRPAVFVPDPSPAAARRDVRPVDRFVRWRHGRGVAVDALGAAVKRRAEIDAEISELVQAARSQGVTWAAIGAAVGLSRDGAVSRWGRT